MFEGEEGILLKGKVNEFVEVEKWMFCLVKGSSLVWFGDGLKIGRWSLWGYRIIIYSY